MRRIKCEWVPGVGVGVIRFGAPVNHLVEKGYLSPEPHDPPFDMDESYEDSESRLSVDVGDDGLVDTIMADETLLYNGQELVSRTPAEIEKIFGPPDEVMEAEQVPGGTELIPWFYEKLGLTVSFEDGVSDIITVDDPDNYED